ncbi:MAG: hypothetical protein AAFP67_13965 [Pseudomonadota bacterium]
MMTADDKKRGAWFEAMAVVRRVRGTWLALTFFAGALFWARDTLEVYHHLPDVVAELVVRLEAIEARACRPSEGFMAAELAERFDVGRR